MAKKFKILTPKPASANELGTEVKLYVVDEIVDAKESWQEDVMNTFLENGWAIEVKVDSADEQGQPVRAKNEDGTFKADDPSTPDVDEAWEVAGKPVKKTTKKTTAKKTTKKTTVKK